MFAKTGLEARGRSYDKECVVSSLFLVVGGGGVGHYKIILARTLRDIHILKLSEVKRVFLN